MDERVEIAIEKQGVTDEGNLFPVQEFRFVPQMIPIDSVALVESINQSQDKPA